MTDDGARAVSRGAALRLMLGELPQAIDDESRLASTYRDDRILPVVRSTTVAIVEHELAMGDAEGARKLLQARIQSEAGHASVRSRLELYTRLGRALQALGKSEEAKRASDGAMGVEDEMLLPPATPMSPRWAIRTLATVGAMWDALRKTFQSVPFPKSVPSPELDWLMRSAYFDTACPDWISSDVHNRAAAAYKMCLEVAAKNQIVDDSSRQCEAGLVRNRRAEYVTTEGPLRDLFVRHDGRGEPLPLPDVLR